MKQNFFIHHKRKRKKIPKCSQGHRSKGSGKVEKRLKNAFRCKGNCSLIDLD